MATSIRRVTGAATFGTVLEWYDFFLYGTAAALVFPALFFPKSDPLTATLLSFAVYATGFVARPIGGIISGHIGDRLGRRTMLVITLMTMGIGTFCIGLLPTYDQVGQLAPVLLVCLRMIQGIATGGEWGGAALLTLEHAKSRPGFWGSFISAAVFLGLILGTLTFTILDAALSDAALLSWGWRVPFLLSIIIVGVGIFIRRKITETPAFTEIKQTDTRERLPLLQALKHPRNILAIFFMRIGQNTSFYIISVFGLSYATTTLELPRSTILTALLVGSTGALLTCPLFGHLADKFGAQKLMAISLAFQILFAFPLFWLIDSGSTAAILLAVTVGIAGATAANDAVQPAYFTSMFGTSIRYSGVSIGREGGTIIGGGLSPLIATALLAWAGGPWPIASWMAITSLAGLVAAFAARPVTEQSPGVLETVPTPSADRPTPSLTSLD